MDGVETQYKGQVKFIRVDMATQEGKDLAGKYYVFGTPVVIFFDEEGEEVNRLMGYHSAESLAEAIDDFLGQ